MVGVGGWIDLIVVMQIAGWVDVYSWDVWYSV